MDKWFYRTWFAVVGCLMVGGAVEVVHLLTPPQGPTAEERATREEQKATRLLFDRYLRLECERLERQLPADRLGPPPAVLAGKM